LATLAVGEAEPANVRGLALILSDHPPEAEVESESTQRAQARRESMDLEVALKRLLTGATRGFSFSLESLVQVRHGLAKVRRNHGEVGFVCADLSWFRLCGESIGKVEDAGCRSHDR
jgi:hypothetical protein